MNLLRSIFIAVFPAYLLMVGGNAITRLLGGAEPSFSWLGLTLAAFAPLSFFIWIMMSKPARTHLHPVAVTAVSGLGLGITLVMSWRFGDAAGTVHIWAGLALVFWFIYLKWYSMIEPVSEDSLDKGRQLPEFILEDLQGQTVHSCEFRDQPHILVFYRGKWCPFCNAQIGELAASYRDIEKLGAQVVLISPQPQGKNAGLAAHFDVPMLFLRDPDNQAATTLGIRHEWGIPFGMQAAGYDSDTVRPTVLITDSNGIIVYSHLTDNYRIRPEPAEFIKVLETL